MTRTIALKAWIQLGGPQASEASRGVQPANPRVDARPAIVWKIVTIPEAPEPIPLIGERSP